MPTRDWYGFAPYQYLMRNQSLWVLGGRLPCYDLVPVTDLAFGVVLPKVRQNDFERYPLPWLDGRCVQGSGTYSPRRG